MSNFNRELAIEALVDNDFDYINNDDGSGMEYLRYRLETGFTGYRQMLNAELIALMVDRNLDIPVKGE